MLALITAALAAIKEFFGLSTAVTQSVHDATERKAGSDATTTATQQATIASVERQNQAAVNAPGVDGTVASLEEGKF